MIKTDVALKIDCTTALLKKTAMAVSLVGGAGVKRALSESEDSEYSEDEAHYSTASLLLVSNVHPHKPEWGTR